MQQLTLCRYCKLFICVGLVINLVGCAELHSGWNGNSPHYNDSYQTSNFDELLAFGESMATMPSSARAKQCRSLQKRQKALGRTGIVLHLMVGRLLSEGCGEIPKILSELNAIPSNSLDVRTQRLVTIHTEALKRINNTYRKAASTDSKQKSVQSDSESLPSKKTDKNETRLLREKLDAIRSMEKQMDKSGDEQ